MSERLSPLTFLSLLHHPRSGRAMAADELADRRERAGADDDPQDCVRRSDSVDPELIVLTGYDMHGVVRIKIEVAEKDASWWERLALRYMHWRFGSALRVVK